ncbi:MAG: outer membrane beta-barrel protein [candidate division KSB1 bacterium]|nr:outer membrane beta-barrel protein [candidate division KSB1 bacterium]MDQ7065734.1 outer membrane beta-barrel protein [candidate division KSB1 bacterium]
MKISVFVLLAAFMLTGMAPLQAQEGVSIGASIGFYRASLDKIDADFEGARANGAKVENTDGGILAGGYLAYRVSPNFYWRVSLAFWHDQARGTATDLGGEIQITNQVRLLPILLGAQYFLLPERSLIRPYIGGAAGMVLVRNVVSVLLSITDEPPNLSSSAATGSDFMTFPFVGLQFRTSKTLAIFLEAGYKFSNYAIISTDTITGETERGQVSLNGLVVSLGTQVSL